MSVEYQTAESPFEITVSKSVTGKLTQGWKKSQLKNLKIIFFILIRFLKI